MDEKELAGEVRVPYAHMTLAQLATMDKGPGPICDCGLQPIHWVTDHS